MKGGDSKSLVLANAKGQALKMAETVVGTKNTQSKYVIPLISH